MFTSIEGFISIEQSNLFSGDGEEALLDREDVIAAREVFADAALDDINQR